jgi:hypothetical protein
MAITQGLWNVGGVNLPDLGISEFLGVGQNNTAQLTPNAGALDYSNATYNADAGKIGPTQTPNQIPYSPQNTTPIVSNPQPQNNAPSVDWSRGLTGEQVRGMGKNPDTMISRNGLFYEDNGGGASTGPSDAELSAAYDPIFQYLNEAEQSVRSGYGGIQQDINNQYGVSSNTLGTGKSQNLASLDTSGQKVQQTKEDAMSSARRLYNELIQGYGQRFGGSTSAGEAARVLSGNEAQRTMGGVNRDYGNNMALIQQKKVEVEQNYQTGLQQLQATRDAALTQANRDFQQKLLDISNTRASTASEKAQQKLAALQELRNQAYNIQLQNQQFQQQLALQKASDSQSLDSYLAQFNQAGQAGQTAQQGYNPTVSSNLQVGNSGVGGQSTLTGQIGNRKDLTNQYTGAIAPTSTERLYNNIFG